MIQLQIAELLKRRPAGETSLYWLAKKSGISYPTLWRLRDSKTDSIEFRVLEAICLALECVPGDVLVMVPEKKGGKK